ncbi:cholecystokinin receptor type A-like, partial [Limulus polyphemus]|uniref:Cholecystokinin receptor type A-like n=1 Tax=Limulus polyphemus TaxID=6850 RepID=A0ABM1BWN7_LIMPO
MSHKPELEESLENRSSVIPNNAIFFINPEEMLYPWANNPYFFYIIATYVITFMIGATGNIIVIAVMIGDRTSRNVTNIFLVSLAVADLLLLVICAPLDVTHYLVMQWDQEGTVCKIAAYAEQLSAFASILNLVAVTLERFVVIVFPIKSRSLCTMNNFKKLMIGVWVVSLLLATPSAAIK